MKDDDTSFDERLALGWQALSPRPGSVGRVRERLSSATAPERERLPRSAQGPSRSGAFQVPRVIGTRGLLLGLGFVAGWFCRREWAVSPPQDARELTVGGVTVSNVAQQAAPMAPDPSLQKGVLTLAPDQPARTALPIAPGGQTRPHSASANGLKPRRHAHTLNAGDLELSLIQRAERAVRAKNCELALALSAELDEKCPSTKFHEERQAIALMAHCQCGSSDRSVERQRFGQRYPSSVYGDRIALECGAEGPSRATSSPLD